MKKPLFLALGLAFSAALLAAPFEGLARFKVTGAKGKAMEMEFLLGHGKSRMEFEGAKGRKGSMIMDAKAKEVIILMPSQRKYMVRAIDPKKDKGKKPKGSFKKSGKTETILGYASEEYIYEGVEGASSFWGTSELGSFMGDFRSEGEGEGQVEIPQEFRDKGFFPLRVTGPKGRFEAVKIEKKSVDPSVFEIPADYEKLVMPDMGRMMGGKKGGKAKGGMPPGMEEAMKNMTPEQRKMMEQMMKGKGGE